METLLCRRFELALSSGRLVEPALQQHGESCHRCREMAEAHEDITNVLTAPAPALPPDARRRISALVSSEARAEDRLTRRRPAPWAWATAATIILVSTAGAWTWARSQGPTEGASTAVAPAISNGEPISGLSDLVALHKGVAGPPLGTLPEGALVYHSRVPDALRSSLTGREESAVSYASAEAGEASTLFVLQRDRIALDPVIDDILTADGSITLSWEGFQVTLVPREDQLFVVLSNPARPVTTTSYL